MGDLSHLLQDLGYLEVATYLQSGNAAFASPLQETDSISDRIRRGLLQQLGLDLEVTVLTRAQLEAAATANLFPEEADPRRLHLIFLAAPASQERANSVARASLLAEQRGDPDRARLLGSAIYLRTPNGFATSRLAAALLRPGPESGTARNWATVEALLDLFAE